MSTTVTSYTKDAIDALIDGTVVSATVDGNGNLILTMGSGTTANLGLVRGTPGVVFPSGDPTGAQDVINVAAQLSSRGKALLMPGVWYGNSTVSVAPGKSVIGAGKELVTWNNVGSTPAFTLSNSGSVADTGAELSGLTIDGTSSLTGAVGFQAGEMFTLRTDVCVQNFTSGKTGAHFLNTTLAAECGTHKISIVNCDKGVVLDQSGSGSTSYARSRFELSFDQFSTQDGLIMAGSGTSGVVLQEGFLKISGRWKKSTASTGVVLRYSTSNAHINTSDVEIGVEVVSNGGNTGVPQSINFKDSTNSISNCHGVIEFLSNANAFSASNNNQNIWFDGPVTGDSSLVVKIGSPYYSSYISSGYPTGITGSIKFELNKGDGKVYVQIILTIASGTVLTNGGAIIGSGSVPSWATPPADRIVIADLSNSYTPMKISATSGLLYAGTTQTLGSTKFLFCQAVYSNSQ